MKKEVKIICSNCGKEPSANKKDSTADWRVIDMGSCKFCGGDLEIKIIEGKKIRK